MGEPKATALRPVMVAGLRDTEVNESHSAW